MRITIRVVAVIAAAALPFAEPAHAGFSAAKAARACPGADTAPTAATLQEARATVLCLINRERGLRGLRHVQRVAKLDRAAQRHSRHMNAKNFFAHETPTGRTVEQRVRAAGYTAPVGENIAWGGGRYATPVETMRGWMNSSGHRRNILRPGWRGVGVGIALGSPIRGMNVGATYTTDFGAR